MHLQERYRHHRSLGMARRTGLALRLSKVGLVVLEARCGPSGVLVAGPRTELGHIESSVEMHQMLGRNVPVAEMLLNVCSGLSKGTHRGTNVADLKVLVLVWLRCATLWSRRQTEEVVRHRSRVKVREVNVGVHGGPLVRAEMEN